MKTHPPKEGETDETEKKISFMYLTQSVYVTDSFPSDCKCSIKIKLVQISFKQKEPELLCKKNV